MPTKLSIGGNIGVTVGLDAKVSVGVTIGGIGVWVGTSVSIGKGVFVGQDLKVGGTGVEAGAHPLDKTGRNAHTSNIDPIDFFMSQTPFDYAGLRPTTECIDAGVHLANSFAKTLSSKAG